MYIFAYFSQQAFFWERESKEGEVSVVHIVMKKWMRDTSYAHNFITKNIILVDRYKFTDKDGLDFTFIRWVHDRED